MRVCGCVSVGVSVSWIWLPPEHDTRILTYLIRRITIERVKILTVSVDLRLYGLFKGVFRVVVCLCVPCQANV